MELVNATRKAIDSGPGAADRPSARPPRSSRSCCRCSPPYVAEDMWSLLGHEPAVARAGWPAVDESLLVEDTVTCVVQVKGKVRDRLEVAPDITQEALQELAMASEKVQSALAGAGIRTVVVRAPKLVNIVPA